MGLIWRKGGDFGSCDLCKYAKTTRKPQGGEYLDNEFTAHLQAQGTEWCLTTHDTPEHNGVAEALNHLLHTNWLKNHISTHALDNMTPYEAPTSNKPNLSNLHEWGTKVWVHDNGQANAPYPLNATSSLMRTTSSSLLLMTC